LSLKERETPASSSRVVAMYKGLKVAVYKTDKTEISLTRQDLIELINVCSLSLRIIVAVNTIRVVDLD